MTIRAVVFDFDGLILDTETSIFESWCVAFEEHGCTPPTIDEWAAEVGTVGGLDVDRVARVACGGLVRCRRNASTTACAIATTSSRAKSRVRASIEWIDDGRGARASDSRSRRAPSASGSSRTVAASDCGIASRTSRVTAPDLRRNRRPTPISKRAPRFGVAPSDAIALEDSPHGVDAARAAGLRVVAVPNPVTAQMDLSAADLVITSLAECSLADVLARFGA